MLDKIKTADDSEDGGVGCSLTVDPLDLLWAVWVTLDKHCTTYIGLSHLRHGLVNGVSPGLVMAAVNIITTNVKPENFFLMWLRKSMGNILIGKTFLHVQIKNMEVTVNYFTDHFSQCHDRIKEDKQEILFKYQILPLAVFCLHMILQTCLIFDICTL